MILIYEPGGKAKEYSPLALNIYKGCVHGCKYCYAPSATFTSKEDFFDDVEVKKTFSIAKLQKEAKSWKGEKKPVLLSFTHDPYQPIEKEKLLVRESIKVLKANGFPVKILTKAGRLPHRDFDLLDENDWFGVTLTVGSLSLKSKWEPEAASYGERTSSLYLAKSHGINTWVSFEPVISPTHTIEMIDANHEVIDKIMVGKWNHDKRANKINWKKFVHNVVKLLESLDCDYYIKKDLREYLEGDDQNE